MIIKKNNLIKEKLIIKNGLKRLKINVVIHIDDIIRDYDKMQKELVEAETAIKESPTEINKEKYGKAVIDLLTVVFGEKDTCKLLKFYENRYIELLLDIFPFLQNNIVPKLQVDVIEKAKQNRK